MRIKEFSSDTLLYTGDALVLVLVTAVGFAFHGELATAGTRMLSTYVPFAVGWALVAPWLGLYHPAIIHNPRQLWRPLWAVVLAAPLAGLLRAFWLNTVVIPIFIVALGGITALAMVAWRGIWLLLRRNQVMNG